METLLLGSPSDFRLILTVSSATVAAAAAEQRIKFFLVDWNLLQVRLKLL